MTGSGRGAAAGFTLIEMVLAALTLLIAFGAILGAYFGQLTLNEHARNLSLAVHDANRVIEQMRRNNIACGSLPTARAFAGNPSVFFNNWDAWLAETLVNSGGGGKSLGAATERIFVTCQDRDGGALATDYCNAAQVATGVNGEWVSNAGSVNHDPLRVTVAVCWRHRTRVIGQCTWDGANLQPNDLTPPIGTVGVIDSPAMLTTLVTCRG